MARTGKKSRARDWLRYAAGMGVETAFILALALLAYAISVAAMAVHP